MIESDLVEYELTYTVKMIIEAYSQDEAIDQAHEMLNEVSFDHTLDDIRC